MKLLFGLLLSLFGLNGYEFANVDWETEIEDMEQAVNNCNF